MLEHPIFALPQAGVPESDLRMRPFDHRGRRRWSFLEKSPLRGFFEEGKSRFTSSARPSRRARCRSGNLVIFAIADAKSSLREVPMTETARDLVIVMTRGTDHELSSVAFTIANGGLTAGLKVYAFLTSASVDLVRKRAMDLTHVPPLDPLGALVADFLKRGGVIWACPPCATARGYTQDDFIAGVTIQGASAMHALIQKGAATLSF